MNIIQSAERDCRLSGEGSGNLFNVLRIFNTIECPSNLMDAAVDKKYLGTALIVEDESLLALVVERLLAKHGYKVVGIAKQCVERLEERRVGSDGIERSTTETV